MGTVIDIHLARRQRLSRRIASKLLSSTLVTRIALLPMVGINLTADDLRRVKESIPPDLLEEINV